MSSTPADRPMHLRPSLIGLVIVGGTLGTAAREGVSLTVGTVGSFPLAIFLINVLGAGALGILLERLAHDGPGAPRRQRARLFAGTGFLGGFTTYSALATDTDLLFRAGDVSTGILYAGGSLVLGFIAAWAGIVLGGSLRRRATPVADA
ncbi:MAG: CrcB family protein [Mycetocola sp.]